MPSGCDLSSERYQIYLGDAGGNTDPSSERSLLKGQTRSVVDILKATVVLRHGGQQHNVHHLGPIVEESVDFAMIRRVLLFLISNKIAL